MSNAPDWLQRADTINRLYMKRFHRQAPGHSEPLPTGRDSNDRENHEQYDEWINKTAIWDACDFIAKLEKEIGELSDELGI